MSRARDAGGDLAAPLRRRRQDQVGGGHRRHVDMQVDAVEQRSRQPVLIIGDTARIRSALAHEAWIVRARLAHKNICRTKRLKLGWGKHQQGRLT